jgi:predicted SAM-dependent methyltransferase
MKKGLNIGAGPLRLESNTFCEWENSDGADTESAKSWRLEKIRDFTKPFEDIVDNSIDYIVFWHCVEHLGLHEKDGVLTEFLRMLKSGGKLFIACPDLTKIARHIIDRDGPWADWFICAVNVMGPYNGYVGDYHKWIYNFEELGKILRGLGYGDYQELTPQILADNIGIENANKLGFAEYNLQAQATKS